jgi:hypothetical protein
MTSRLRALTVTANGLQFGVLEVGSGPLALRLHSSPILLTRGGICCQGWLMRVSGGGAVHARVCADRYPRMAASSWGRSSPTHPTDCTTPWVATALSPDDRVSIRAHGPGSEWCVAGCASIDGPFGVSLNP